MAILKGLAVWFRSTTDLSGELDRSGAAARIRSNIWFRGANVWILAFSIIIASVGLNVNSTAVIIGAMLVSPLMGPIIGIGFSMGTYDGKMMKDALRNLLVMFLVSLAASTAYFLISPLSLADPTELEARTSPTIYDVLIALFGGLAGMLENSRSERGTVLSGVAIATALMPPLCTAGYGLATGSTHFLFGALFLFLINTVFIVLATYMMTKFLRFPAVSFQDARARKRIRNVVSLVMVLILVPSIMSAIQMVRVNQFEKRVVEFVGQNQMFGGRYLYDYKVNRGWTPTADIFLTGDPLKDYEKDVLLTAARACGIEPGRLEIHEKTFGSGREIDYESLTRDFFRRYEEDIAQRDARIEELKEELQLLREPEFDYVQISREMRTQFTGVSEMALARGSRIKLEDDAELDPGIFVTVVVDSTFQKGDQLLRWLKLRLASDDVVLYQTRRPRAGETFLQPVSHSLNAPALQPLREEDASQSADEN